LEKWNVTLTQSQIQAMYNVEKQGTTKYVYTPSTAPTVSVSPTKTMDIAVSTWRGENNADDRYGAHNAIVIGTPTYIQGQVGRAFYFDRSSYLKVPYSLSLDFANNGEAGLTMKAWVKLAPDGQNIEFGVFPNIHYGFNGMQIWMYTDVNTV